jgi:hypothetical protein
VPPAHAEKSRKALKDTYGEQKGYAAALKTGRGILTRLERRDRTDKWLMTAAISFFVLVMLYIFKKRVAAPVVGFIWNMTGAWFVSPETGAA